MTSLTRLYRALALMALTAFSTGTALADTTWNLDGTCATKAGGGFIGCQDTLNNSNGVKVDITAYSATALTTGTKFSTTQTNINNGSGYIGVYTKTESGQSSPHHAIDNYTAYGNPIELVYLKFTQAVDLTNVTAYWSNDQIPASTNNADFEVWRWNDAGSTPNVTTYGPGAMSGWTSVKSGDFDVNKVQDINDGIYFSSHWLITTPLGGGGNNDAFKLGMVTAINTCAASNVNPQGGCGGNSPGGNIPEPMSLALVAAAALGAGAARRRARAPLAHA